MGVICCYNSFSKEEEMEPNRGHDFKDSTLKKTTLDISLGFHLGGRLRPSESLSSEERMMCLCFAL